MDAKAYLNVHLHLDLNHALHAHVPVHQLQLLGHALLQRRACLFQVTDARQLAVRGAQADA